MIGKNILILGFGISGKSAANILLENGKNVYIYDDLLIKNGSNEIIKDYPGLTFLNNKEDIEDLSWDFIMKSPGIKPSSEIIEFLNRKNLSYYSDIELAYRLKKDEKIIAITGTNGKTTTTLLLEKILKNANINAKAVGNIGLGAVEEIGKHTSQVYVVECSSFQLEDIEYFKPDMAIITNIDSDHLDYHGSKENYINAKLKLLKNFDNESLLVTDSSLAEKYRLNDRNFQKLYSNISGNFGDAYFDGKYIYLDSEKFIDMEDLFLRGDHNIQNIMDALLVANYMGLDKESIKNTVKEFRSVDHRLEFVDEVSGVKYYNDSKGTNPNSTEVALKAFDKEDVILIMGGYDKGDSFTKLLSGNKNKIKALIAFGDTKEKISNQAKDSGIATIICVENLKNALEQAVKYASLGDIVLFSPACASWDMYKNYEERGNEFKELVSKIGDNID